MIAPLVLEGTWDEISARADELRGWRLRVHFLSPISAPERDQAATGLPAEQPRPSSSAVLDQSADQIREEPAGYPVAPFLMTDECSLPFDLPRPGEPELVPYIDGGDRLPEFPPEWRNKEQDGV